MHTRAQLEIFQRQPQFPKSTLFLLLSRFQEGVIFPFLLARQRLCSSGRIYHFNMHQKLGKTLLQGESFRKKHLFLTIPYLPSFLLLSFPFCVSGTHMHTGLTGTYVPMGMVADRSLHQSRVNYKKPVMDTLTVYIKERQPQNKHNTSQKEIKCSKSTSYLSSTHTFQIHCCIYNV